MRTYIKHRGRGYALAVLCLAAQLPMAAQAAQLTEADTDKDGQISRSEAKAAQDKSFRRLDANDNGKLDRNEFARGQPGLPANADKQDRQHRRRLLKSWFDNMDTNRNGKISRAEYRKAVAPYFDRMDANGDGFISADELKSAFHGSRSGRGQSSDAK